MFNFLCSIVAGFMKIIFRIEVKGLENIPKTGSAILCANHISNWDPVLLQAFIKRHIYFMSKEELFRVFFVGWLLKKLGAIPVKRTGSDLTAIKLSFKTVNGGEMLGIFPTGQREKVKGEGEVKSGVGLIAGKTKAPVIPIHISASFKPFSKVVLNIGRAEVFAPPEGEKVNAEMAEVFSKEIYQRIKDLA